MGWLVATIHKSEGEPRDPGDSVPAGHVATGEFRESAQPEQQATDASADSAPQEQQTTGDAGGFSLPMQQADGDSYTILLMGVDARPGDAIDVGVRPDTLAVLHLESETGSCRLLSVPRDTRTELPGYGPSKINHALAVGGIPYQALVTQNLLGLEIDHYGLIDFSGIESLVDAVGGVTVTNDAAFTIEGITFYVGEITLDGEEALAYARFRNDAEGDFGRIGRQQQIVRSLINQTSGMDIVTGAYELLGAVDGHIKTDFSAVDLIGLAIDFRSSCTETSLEVDTLNGTVQTLSDSLLNMPLSFVVVDPADIEQKVEWLLGTQ
jgi:LCP family protein required for cell wall assembly